MRRRLFTLTSVLSLLVGTTVGIFWVRSYWHPYFTRFGSFNVWSSDGQLTVARVWYDNAVDVQFNYWWCVALLFVIPVLRLCSWPKGRSRHRSGFCPTCAYNLTGNTSGVCPECGTRIE